MMMNPFQHQHQRRCYYGISICVLLFVMILSTSNGFLIAPRFHYKDSRWTTIRYLDLSTPNDISLQRQKQQIEQQIQIQQPREQQQQQKQQLRTKDPVGGGSQRVVAQRWNGNHKRSSKKLCDVPKAKKLNLQLSIRRREDGEIITKTILKKRQETLQHVLTKAILWKLYSEEYENIDIEQDIGDPDYLPDVISLNLQGRPVFWGESGRMKVHKAIDLMKRYPEVHIVHCRWDMELSEIEAPLMGHLQDLLDQDKLGILPDRSGRFTFCSVPLDVWRFIDEETGFINLDKDDLKWKELVFPTTKSTISSL